MRGARVKPESGGVSLEDQVLAIIQATPNGVEDHAFMHLAEGAAIGDAVNALLKRHRIEVLTKEGKPALFKAQTADRVTRLKGLSPTDELVLATIQDAGDVGIWMKDLRYKTTLAAQPVSKSVRLLEERRLIKPVTAWDNPSRKMYMAFDVVPRKSTVGSSWFAQSEGLNTTLVETLQTALEGIVQAKGEVTVSAAHDAMLGLMKEGQFLGGRAVPPSSELRIIMKSLEYDGKLECWQGDDDEEVFAIHPGTLVEKSPLSCIPCGICPVASDCTPDGPISPARCQYYKAWLAF